MNTTIKSLVLAGFVVLVGLAGYSAWDKNSKDSAASALTEVSGIITSEKETFLTDPDFVKLLAANGFVMNNQRWTSDQILAVKDKAGFGKYSDFVFPSSNQVSDKVKQSFKGAQATTILYSPMVIATRTPIVNILDANGFLIQKGSYKALDMNKFLPAMEQKTKWSSLKQNTDYSVNKNILISTSDSRRSGSSKMFISLSSYILNGNEVIQSQGAAQNVIPKIKNLMSAQGYRESSSADLFNDYVSVGMGKAPMIFVYESQMVELAVKNGGLKDQMQILYPSPTIFSKHVMVSLSPNGEKLMNFLANNENVKKIAAKYGFRITGGNHLMDVAKTVNLSLPQTIVDVVEQPDLEVQDLLVNEVEAK